MKICYICDAAFPWSCGGSEKRLHEISERMKAKGHGVTIVCMEDKMHWAGERRSILHGLKFAWKVFNHLRKNKYDYIECMQSPIIHIPVVWAMKGKAKFNVSWFECWNKKIDGIPYWIKYAGPIVGRIGMFFEWLALRLPDKIIVPSEQTKQDVIVAGVTKSVSIVNNGIDFKKVNELKPFKERYDIISVSRLIKGKNVNLSIWAASKIKGCKVCVIGAGPELKSLQRLAKKLKVNVVFKGMMESDDDVIRYIKSSKVFSHPSVQEGGASFTLFESAACGIPLVTTNHPLGIDNSLLIKCLGYSCGEASDLPKLISIAMKEKKDLKKKRILAAKEFDWKNVIPQYEKAIG